MEEQAEVYKPLGIKTLTLFILQKIPILGFFLAAAMICRVMLRVMPMYAGMLYWIMAVIIGGGFVTAGIIFTAAYIMYTRYGITLAPDNLKITRGFINEEEIGIPYRRVKDARIERDVIDQLVGTSDILINTADADDGGRDVRASFIVLPAIEKNLAAHIQSEMVKRAQVEEIRVEPSVEK